MAKATVVAYTIVHESIKVNTITKDLKVELKRRDKWEHIVLGAPVQALGANQHHPLQSFKNTF